MRNSICVALLCALVLLSCRTNKKDIKGDKAFDEFKNRFIENFWQVYPSWGNSVGYHKYDSVLVIPNEAERKKEKDFNQNYLDSLKRVDLKSLSANEIIDYHMIENQLQSAIWGLDTFKSYEWNPSQYNIGDDFALLLTENYAPLEKRLYSFEVKLPKVKAYFEAAKRNIKNPTIEHTDLAISQNTGTVEIFSKMLMEKLNESRMEQYQKANLMKSAAEAVSAINDYVGWLKDSVRPKLNEKTAHSFRIGKALYDRKFWFDIQSDYTAEQIYKKAVARKDQLHDSMAKIAGVLWPKYFGKQPLPGNKLELIRKVIDTLAATHATRESFQSSIEKQLPELTSFINSKKLLFLNPDKPLVVRQTPDYMAGVSVASINAPGPYEKNANTYYNVGSLKDYTPEQAESFLREYNKYTLQIINIHEAIPGHYTQLIYSNQSPSLIKSIFGNGAMVEGWAVYTERMMLEEGYGENDPAMWLMYYKWHLRAVCNTILDYGMHVKNMSHEDALHLLRDEAFQTETEAEGKWKRATYTQVQLCSYYTGFTEIYDLREEIKKRLGSQFDLKAFHEKFLSYGSAPVKYIRQMMLNDLNDKTKKNG